MNNKLIESIATANPVQIDALWAILKYKEIGILRKITCMCSLLGLSEAEVVADMPQNEDGRILDKKSRDLICDQLIKFSRKA